MLLNASDILFSHHWALVLATWMEEDMEGIQPNKCTTKDHQSHFSPFTRLPTLSTLYILSTSTFSYSKWLKKLWETRGNLDQNDCSWTRTIPTRSLGTHNVWVNTRSDVILILTSSTIDKKLKNKLKINKKLEINFSKKLENWKNIFPKILRFF